MRAGLFALLLLLILLAPAGTAQVPPTQTCGPLTVTGSTPAALQPGGATSVSVTVRNEGRQAADVTVAASTPSQGWTIQSETSQTSNVAAGATSTFTFTVGADEGATQDGVVNFATSGTCPPPGSVPCPQNACTTQAEAFSVAVPLEAREPFRIPGLDGLDFPLEYLVAGIVLVAVAIAIPFLVRKRQASGAVLSCAEPLKPVKPGKGASFPLEIKNMTDAPMRTALEVGAVPEGWSAFLPLAEVQLAAKESRSLWLMVRTPPTAQAGDKADVEVRAIDPERPERPVILRVRAEVMEGSVPNGEA